MDLKGLVLGSILGNASFIGTNKQLVRLRGHGPGPLAFPSKVLSANHSEPIKLNPNITNKSNIYRNINGMIFHLNLILFI